MKFSSALFLALALAAAPISAETAAEARIDELFVRELLDGGMAGFQTKEGLRSLYEECVAIDPGYWRTAYVKMLYEDMVAEDRSGILKALGTAKEAWAVFSGDARNMEAFELNLQPTREDMGGEEAWKTFINRLRKQMDAIRILGLRANLLEALDEREAADDALSPLVDSSNALARYEGLERRYWLRIKYLSLAEARDLLSEVETTRAEVEADIASNEWMDAPYSTSYKHYYSTGLGNEAAILRGFAYDIEGSLKQYRDLMDGDRAFALSRGWYYAPDRTLLSNIQLLRLSAFDFDGLDENHLEDDSFYAFLQARYEALLSRGRPLEARAAAKDSKVDPRYYTEGMRRLFRGQSSLLSGDARAAMANLEYAAGYREVFRDISYTLSNYQARVHSELVAACAAERGLRRLEGKPGILSLPLRAKEFYYRFLLVSNLRTHPDYATLFSPFMNARDMSMSPYAAVEALRSLDGRIAGAKLDAVRDIDPRPRASKYYLLFDAEIALSSLGGSKRAAELLSGEPDGSDDRDALRDERLYLAMAYGARARLAEKRRDREALGRNALAAYRVFPSFAATMGFKFEFAEMRIIDEIGGRDGALIAKHLRRAAGKWRLSWRKGGEGLPRPLIRLSAEGEGAARRYTIRVDVEDPYSLRASGDGEIGDSLVLYAQDLKRGSYPSWVLRAMFGIRTEDAEAALPAENGSIPGAADDGTLGAFGPGA